MSKIHFDGKILILGFGSITLGALPLLIERIDIQVSDIRIISKDTLHKSVADSYGIGYSEIEITEQNYQNVLMEQFHLSKGDFLINLSVGISSKDLMKLCHEIGSLYIDTCIEPWEGFYDNENLSISQRSNYALRHDMFQEKEKVTGGPTAVIAHGANPGLVSHFVKRALIEIHQLKSPDKSTNVPKTQQEWAQLAKNLGVKVIQISERDTQRPLVPKQRNQFVNTWSIDGFISEGVHQPSEMGFGTHEKEIPVGGNQHEFGCKSAIYLSQPGGSVKVRGWTPLEDIYHGFLVTHNESISITSY
jgi:homospermidine synthase